MCFRVKAYWREGKDNEEEEWVWQKENVCTGNEVRSDNM